MITIPREPPITAPIAIPADSWSLLPEDAALLSVGSEVGVAMYIHG